MISFILSKTFDLVWYALHYGYKGTRALYYYYYNMDYPEVAEQKKKDAVIEELETRIKQLEDVQNCRIPWNANQIMYV